MKNASLAILLLGSSSLYAMQGIHSTRGERDKFTWDEFNALSEEQLQERFSHEVARIRKGLGTAVFNEFCLAWKRDGLNDFAHAFDQCVNRGIQRYHYNGTVDAQVSYKKVTTNLFPRSLHHARVRVTLTMPEFLAFVNMLDQQKNKENHKKLSARSHHVCASAGL